MVQTADHVEWIVAKNEVEAFFLEFNLIKRHKPRFNIRLKDDKRTRTSRSRSTRSGRGRW